MMVPVPIPTDSKPLTKLIDVVAKGIGTVYRPAGTVLQAMADAKAKVILADGDAKASELMMQAAHRLAYTEVERQKNLNSIVAKAQAALPEAVAERPVEKDWSTHFFGAAQDVSDEDMHEIWAKILAGEVAEPGTTSRRTLEFLKTMGKDEAEAFGAILSFSLMYQKGEYFYVNEREPHEAISKRFPNRQIINHLRDIGIFASFPSALRFDRDSKVILSYGGTEYLFRHGAGDVPTVFLNIFNFTNIGQELSKVAKQVPVPEFISMLNSGHGIQIEKK